METAKAIDNPSSRVVVYAYVMDVTQRANIAQTNLININVYNRESRSAQDRTLKYSIQASGFPSAERPAIYAFRKR